MTPPFESVAADPAVDPAALMEEAVAARQDALGALAPFLRVEEVRDGRSLRRFLEAYRSGVLLPVEWQAVLKAYGHTVRGQARELVALDGDLGREEALRRFLAPSCRVGQRHLSRLRGLQDVRLVQRYLAAVEGGRARGWHPLVYGVWLGVFALPLRQGLALYARQTLEGFVEGAGRAVALDHGERQELIETVCEPLPGALDQALELAGVVSLAGA